MHPTGRYAAHKGTSGQQANPVEIIGDAGRFADGIAAVTDGSQAMLKDSSRMIQTDLRSMVCYLVMCSDLRWCLSIGAV